MTPAEYLAWERDQPQKHEYYRGEVFAMAGATREHNLIVMNLGAELRAALRDRPCEAYPSDMRVRIPATGLYTYPDVTVVCGRPEFEDGVLDTLLNPQLLAEVLSTSTEAYDRGGKFEQYRTLPLALRVPPRRAGQGARRSLREAARRLVADALPARRERLELASLGCSIAIDEIYLKVFGGEGQAAAGPVTSS